jgi:hypothetical protein
VRNFLIGIVLGCFAGIFTGRAIWRSHHPTPFPSTYQAVLLDDNQVFYGKISGLDSPFPVLTEVFYIKTGADPQTKEVKNVLVKRGKELHGPDRMYLNPRHIVLIEPVGPDSQVAKLISESRN